MSSVKSMSNVQCHIVYCKHKASKCNATNLNRLSCITHHCHHNVYLIFLKIVKIETSVLTTQYIVDYGIFLFI